MLLHLKVWNFRIVQTASRKFETDVHGMKTDPFIGGDPPPLRGIEWGKGVKKVVLKVNG